MSLTGGNGGFANGSFRTREVRYKGATVKSRLEQREAALKKQREAFNLAARALSSPPFQTKKSGKVLHGRQ